jgi:DNA polymerase-3 subunit gamma/tau
MSYLVIARKWRPQTFEEVVGQPHISRTLQNAIRLERIAHAYLFTGARGVGKTSVARILAKALNCSQGPQPVPCNGCPNCEEITAGSSVDVIEIDGASNRGIDSIRELRETVRYRPAKSRYKVYIIDEVHMLTPEAFNALLKTLEEPPSHVIFIFATTEPHKIPSTILSRCQRFDFRRISTAALMEHLQRIAEAEGASISDGVLYALAREADGSMRDGQSLLEQVLAFSGDGLSDNEVLDVLGIVDRMSVHRAGQAIHQGDVRACLEVASDLHRRGIDSRRFAQSLCDYFRHLMLLCIGGSEMEELVDLPAEEREHLKKIAEGTTTETVFLYFQMVLKGEEDIRRSTLPRAVLEMLLLRMAQLPRLESLPGIMEKLSSIEERIGSRSGHSISASESNHVFNSSRPSVSRAPESDLKGRHSDEVQPRGKQSTKGEVIGDGRMLRGQPAMQFEPLPQGPPYSELASIPPNDHDSSSGPATPESSPVHEGGAPAVAPVTRVDEVVEGWHRFVEWLMNRDPILGAKLNGSTVQAENETGLNVEVSELFAEKLKDTQSLEKLSLAAADYFGVNYFWAVRSKSEVKDPVKRPKMQTASKPNPKRVVMEHPMVLQAIEMLGGELVEIKAIKPDKASRKFDD